MVDSPVGLLLGKALKIFLSMIKGFDFMADQN